MITVKHPIERYNREQEEYLRTCPPEERRSKELLFTVGNIAYRYHTRAQESEPSERDWREWLEGLPQGVRTDMERKGFENCKTVLSFSRYVNEKNDIGMEEYIRQQMGAEYDEFKAMSEEQ